MHNTLTRTVIARKWTSLGDLVVRKLEVTADGGVIHEEIILTTEAEVPEPLQLVE